MVDLNVVMDPVMMIGCKLSKAALLEQLAEECSELSKESLKLARILRGENPTPLVSEDVTPNLIEEFTDVMLVSRVLGLNIDQKQMNYKKNRWLGRLEEANNANK